MNGPQLTVRVATIGRPNTLSELADVSVPSNLKNGDVLYYNSGNQNFTIDTLPFVDGSNTLVKLKRSTTSPSISSLADGELYYSFVDKKLYIGDQSGNFIAIAGQYYSDQSNTIFLFANTTQNNLIRTSATANAAFLRANEAYELANTKLDKIGGIISGDLVITGNITVSGQTTYSNTVEILVGDNIIELNADLPITTPPTEDAGIKINRGSSANVSLLWNEAIEKWTFTVDGTNYSIIPTNTAVEFVTTASEFAFGQANTARTHANTAHITANASFVQSNTARDHANTSHLQANTTRSHANAAFVQANTAYNVANTKLNLSGGTIAGDLVVTGNVTVSGSTIYANTTQLQVGDAVITLNADLPAAFAPSENAGIEVNRGSSANAYLLWNEATDTWTFANGNAIYYNIPTNTAVEIATAIGQAAFLQANTTRDHANTAHVTANAGFVQANTARDHANVAFAKANAALPNVSGSVFNGNLIVSGNLNAQFARLADGSNVSPSISFANSVNTGIYRTSNNRMSFSVQGEDVLTLMNSLGTAPTFEILDANNESIFSVTAVDQGNVLELYDVFTSNTLLFSVDSNQLFTKNAINVNSDLVITANTRIAPSNVATELTRFSANTFAGGKFTIIGRSGTSTHISELNVVHDGNTAYFSEYGMVFSNVSLFTLQASINTNNVIISVLPVLNAITTFTIVENRLIV